ncbi:MAG: hypothetical protein C0403_13950 [Desulfobacterium sp.]|nr:hypothetical protein [Desulfobacterium sp.]
MSWYSLTEGQEWGDDFAEYIMQAQSITEKNPTGFIEKNRFTIETSTHTVGPVAYPWGYPMLLAPLYYLFGMNLLAFKSLNIICYLFFLLSLWWGCRTSHSSIERMILVSLFAMHPYFMEFMDNVVSDIPFLLFSTITIFFMGRIVIQKKTLISNFTDQLLLGLLIAISFFIRTQGILILATLGATQLILVMQHITARKTTATESIMESRHQLFPISRNRLVSLLIIISPYLFFFILVLIWQTFLPEGGTSHTSEMKRISLESIKHNLLFYNKLPAEFFTGFYSKITLILYGASLPLFIIGLFKRRNSDYHIIIYGALYIVLMIGWPYTQGFRYLLPVIPFYVSFVLTGMVSFADTRDRSLNLFWRIGSTCVVIAIIAVSWNTSFKNVTTSGGHEQIKKIGPYYSTAQDLFTFIKSHTEEDSIVIFFKPRLMRLFTNRQSIMIENIDKVTKGDYLCFQKIYDNNNQIEKNDLDSLLKNEAIQLIYQNVDFQLYRIMRQ